MSDRKPGTVPDVELVERKLACENGRSYVYLDSGEAMKKSRFTEEQITFACPCFSGANHALLMKIP